MPGSSVTCLTLTRAESRQLIRLLGELHTRLEEEIICAEPLADRGQPGYLPGQKQAIAKTRRDNALAEEWVKRLEGNRG